MVDLGMYACTNTFDCACGKEALEKWQQFAEVSIVENVMIMVILLANSRAVLSWWRRGAEQDKEWMDCAAYFYQELTDEPDLMLAAPAAVHSQMYGGRGDFYGQLFLWDRMRREGITKHLFAIKSINHYDRERAYHCLNSFFNRCFVGFTKYIGICNIIIMENNKKLPFLATCKLKLPKKKNCWVAAECAFGEYKH